MTEYQEAVQAPSVCFFDDELRGGRVLCDRLGLPRPICGQFATVYAIEQAQRRWAVKCFLRDVPDLHERYARIAAHLAAHPSPCFVGFDLLPEGILVRGRRYPLLRMEWVRGIPLNHFVERWRARPEVLAALGEAWDALLGGLRRVGVAHGDLQHGNVLVDADGTLRLVDYDGMWVPALAGAASLENGHPNYQEPARCGEDFDAPVGSRTLPSACSSIDRFAGDVIAVAIRALALRPGLWDAYDNGDNLLFRETDFTDPKRSPLIGDLAGIADAALQRRLDGLLARCAAGATCRRSLPVQVRGRGEPVHQRPSTVTRARKHGSSGPRRPAVGGSLTHCTRLLGQLRVLLHLVGIWPALTFAAIGGAACLAGDADWTMAVAVPAFAIAALLGLVSLTTLYVVRTAHALVATLFFGMLGAIGLVCLGAEGLLRGSLAAIAEIEPARLILVAGLLGVSGLALTVELACHRMGIVSAWRTRRA